MKKKKSGKNYEYLDEDNKYFNWIFPTLEVVKYTEHNFRLTKKEIIEFKTNKKVKKNLKKSSFYQKKKKKKDSLKIHRMLPNNVRFLRNSTHGQANWDLN